MMRRILGDWELRTPLGEGGMGTVYRAVHRRTGRQAALKAVTRADEAALAGLRREILALARVEHPGVVRILDHGEADGLPWYAMELIEGRPLLSYVAADGADTLAQSSATWWTLQLDDEDASNPAASLPAPTPAGALDPERLRRVLTVARRLCDALAWLHGEGLVHRDLKPENVIVRPGEEPVLVDFGLTVQVGGAEGRERLDAVRAAGTPWYVAPEQASGELVDARADLYGLGCILFHLLTGAPPFDEPDPRLVVWCHLERRPPALAERLPGVSPALDDLVARLLRKDPAERPGYATDVGRILAGLGAAPTPAAPAPRPYLYRPRLVGRRQLYEGLCRTVEETVRGAASGAVAIRGQSGAGKTRLALEAVHEATHHEALLLVGEALPAVDGGPSARSLGPLRAPLQQLVDRCVARGEDALLGWEVRLLADLVPAFAAVVSDPPAERPHDLARYTALAAILRRVAAQRPVVVVLDDLQWADRLTVGFLAWLAEREPLPRVLWLLTWRVEEETPTLGRLADAPHTRVVDLELLGRDDIVALARSMLALDASTDDFTAWLAAQAEGNPFFAAEYLRTAIAAGVLGRDDGGRWRLGTGARFEELPLPSRLRDLVAHRLDLLDPELRALVDLAAVQGRDVDPGLLAAALEVPVEVVEARVAALIGVQVLEVHRTDGLRFVHDKVREVAYERLADPAASHAATARALVARGVPADGWAAVAVHHDRAGDAAAARAAYRLAAKHDSWRHAVEEQEAHLRRYLDLVEQPDGEAVVVVDHLLMAVVVHGRRDAEAEGLLARARALASGFDATVTDRANLDVMEGIVALRLGQPERALAAAGRVREVAHALETRSLLARAHDLAAMVVEGRGDLAASRAHRLQARAIYRDLGQADNEALEIYAVAVLAAREGNLDEARELYEEALSVLTDDSSPEVGRRIRVRLANLQAREDLPAAVDTLQATVAGHDDDHHLATLHMARVGLGYYAFQLGRLELARRVLELAGQDLDAADPVRGALVALNLALVEHALGDHLAVEQVRAAAERAGLEGPYGRRALWWYVRLRIEAGRRAEPELEALALEADPAMPPEWRCGIRWLTARIHRIEGRYAEATEALGEHPEAPLDRAFHHVERGWLARAEGADPGPWLREAAILRDRLGVEPRGDLGREVARLAAVAAPRPSAEGAESR